MYKLTASGARMKEQFVRIIAMVIELLCRTVGHNQMQTRDCHCYLIGSMPSARCRALYITPEKCSYVLGKTKERQGWVLSCPGMEECVHGRRQVENFSEDHT